MLENFDAPTSPFHKDDEIKSLYVPLWWAIWKARNDATSRG